MRRYGPADAQVHVYTYKEGLLSPVAHDLLLSVESFAIELDGEGGVEAWFDTTSVRVVCAMKQGRRSPSSLRTADHRKIERTMFKEVLQAGRHPRATFTGRLETRGAMVTDVTGELSLRSRRGPLSVSVAREGELTIGRVRVDKRAFGIRPYTALFGALRLQPHVDVEVRVPGAPG